MTSVTNYSNWLENGNGIRNSVRLIIFDQTRTRLLIEANTGFGNVFYNFIGGAVEIGETLEECLKRELLEEMDKTVSEFKFRFVYENLFTYNSETRHALEYYFEVTFDHREPLPNAQGVEYLWVPLNEIGTVDLRPVTVRDSLIREDFADIRHLTGDGKE